MRYRHRGDLGVPGREAFDSLQGTHASHLYACVARNDALRNHLTVRDYLQSNPSAAQAYGQLKKQLADQFANDIDSYIDGKTEFILAILSRARFSSEQITAIRAINRKPGQPSSPLD